ncbi:hypothetical protein PIROE2DRAFT_15384, partial [Piromyces sp. E2]
MSYILGLNQEDNSIDKRRFNERILTFYYIVCKDIQLSIITGRFYQYNIYDSLNSEITISLLSKLELNKNSIILIMNLVLSKFYQIVLQYIQESRSKSTDDVIFLDEKIKYWINIYEPYFNFEYDIEKEDISNIIPFWQYEVCFYALKILFNRHKLTSVLSKSNEKISNISNKNINETFYKSERNENYNIDLFLKYCLKFIKRKNRIIKSKKSPRLANEENIINISKYTDEIIRIDNENNSIPDFFLIKNYIYLKDQKIKHLKFNYKDTINLMNENVYSEKSEENRKSDLNINKVNLKRTYEQSFSSNNNNNNNDNSINSS